MATSLCAIGSWFCRLIFLAAMPEFLQDVKKAISGQKTGNRMYFIKYIKELCSLLYPLPFLHQVSHYFRTYSDKGVLQFPPYPVLHPSRLIIARIAPLNYSDGLSAFQIISQQFHVLYYICWHTLLIDG